MKMEDSQNYWDNESISCVLLLESTKTRKPQIPHNVLELSMCVSSMIEKKIMPLDVSAKAFAGIVEIYRFHALSLMRSLTSIESVRLSINRKRPNEVDVYIKSSKRGKIHLNSPDWEQFYEDRDDLTLLTDNQIIDYLVTNQHQTKIQNIEDITMREAAPSILCDEADAEDDFGAASYSEMQLFLYPSNENHELSVLPVADESLYTIPNNETLSINDDYERTNIDDTPVYSQLESIDNESMPLVTDSSPLPLPSPSFKPDESSLAVSNQNALVNMTLNSTPTLNKLNYPVPKKTTSNRPTRISFKCNEKSNQEYYKMQVKPVEELVKMLNAARFEKIFSKPLRSTIHDALFQRHAKIKRVKQAVSYDSILQAPWLPGETWKASCVQEKECSAAVAGPTPDMQFVANEPDSTRQVTRNFPAINTVENDTVEGTTPPENEGMFFVSSDELMSLLRRLWKTVPDSLPFEVVKSHMKDRLTAVSVFGQLLEFVSKRLLKIVKREDGSVHSLVKGPAWH